MIESSWCLKRSNYDYFKQLLKIIVKVSQEIFPERNWCYSREKNTFQSEISTDISRGKRELFTVFPKSEPEMVISKHQVKVYLPVWASLF